MLASPDSAHSTSVDTFSVCVGGGGGGGGGVASLNHRLLSMLHGQ